jgi:hypothetical protein
MSSTQLAPITGISNSFQDISIISPTDRLASLISTIYGFLTIVAGLAFILWFVLGSIDWIMSSGDQQKLEGARNKMTSAAIGLIIVVASYAIIGIVGQVVGFDILNPISIINTLGP